MSNLLFSQKSCDVLCPFLRKWFLLIWDSTVVEQRKTIKYCLIVENMPQKNTALVSVRPYIMGFCLIIIEFVFSYRWCHLFRPFYHIFLWVLYLCYVFKTYVCGYIYCNKWDLKHSCQTRKSVRTDFHIWHKACNALMEMKMLRTNFQWPAHLSFSWLRHSFAPSRTYLMWGKWRNLAERILQNIHVNDNDPWTHTLHIALDSIIRNQLVKTLQLTFNIRISKCVPVYSASNLTLFSMRYFKNVKHGPLC